MGQLTTSCVAPFAPGQTPASSNQTFDVALAYACAHPVLGPAVFDAAPSYPCVFSCGGLPGIYQPTGIDTANVELFDPSTKRLVEVGSVVGSPNVECSCSASGAAANCYLPDFGCGPCTDAGVPDGSDAGSCAPLYGPTRTFDQEAASLSTNPQGVANWSVACGTMECDGLLAIVDTHGADAQDLYLFDPTTGDLVETLSGNNGALFCTGSATGIDLTAGAAFSACRPPPYGPYGTGGFDFGGCGDGGPPDASPE